MERTNKAGALSALRMAPSRALPTRKYTKRGDMSTNKSAANSQGFDRTKSFWRGSLRGYSRLADLEHKNVPRRMGDQSWFGFPSQDAGCILLAKRMLPFHTFSMNASWSCGLSTRTAIRGKTPHDVFELSSLRSKVQYVGTKCCNYSSTFRCRFLVNNVFAMVSVWRGSSFVALVTPQHGPFRWSWRRALA